jgi:hypothetical protein
MRIKQLFVPVTYKILLDRSDLMRETENKRRRVAAAVVLATVR